MDELLEPLNNRECEGGIALQELTQLEENPNPTHAQGYADDILYVSSTVQGLPSGVSVCKQHSMENECQVSTQSNTRKSEAMGFKIDEMPPIYTIPQWDWHGAPLNLARRKHSSACGYGLTWHI
jgi:hypothetical protein